MKFRHLIEYNKRSEAQRLVQDIFLFFIKDLHEVKASELP